MNEIAVWVTTKRRDKWQGKTGNVKDEWLILFNVEIWFLCNMQIKTLFAQTISHIEASQTKSWSELSFPLISWTRSISLTIWNAQISSDYFGSKFACKVIRRRTIVYIWRVLKHSQHDPLTKTSLKDCQNSFGNACWLDRKS